MADITEEEVILDTEEAVMFVKSLVSEVFELLKSEEELGEKKHNRADPGLAMTDVSFVRTHLRGMRLQLHF